MAGVRQCMFTCVGWQVTTLCDFIWQVTSRSSEMGFPWRAVSVPMKSYIGLYLYLYCDEVPLRNCSLTQHVGHILGFLSSETHDVKPILCLRLSRCLLSSSQTSWIADKKHTLDWNQSDVYSLCVIFSKSAFSFFLFIPSFPYEISVQSPIICINSHYRIRGQSMVCVHT